jgi:hypothetical protein
MVSLPFKSCNLFVKSEFSFEKCLFIYIFYNIDVCVFQIKSGIVMNLLTVGALVVMFNTLGVLIYDLDEFPSWAEPNGTAPADFTRVTRNISVSLLRH